MSNLIFCLNATVPVFLLMVLGYFFKRVKIFTPEFTKTVNMFVFKIALPVLVFKDLSTQNFYELWDGGYVLFCFIVTILSILIAFILSFLLKDKSTKAEFIQSSYRSSAALLGIGIIENVYGNSGMAPLMIIGCVPLYNVIAVILLDFFKPNRGKMDADTIKKTFIGILKNPIIIGIFIGVVWSLIGIPQATIFSKTVNYISNLATPLGLMALGASIEFGAVSDKLLPALSATALKLLLWPAIFLPLSIHFGFTTDKLVAILIMLGSPTTVSCFVMAKSMGHEGTTSAACVMFTTLLSAFTLTAWLYILKSLGLV